MENRKLIPPDEVARILRVSVPYLQNTIIPRGELKPVDEGMMFDEGEVLRYRELDSQRRKKAIKEHLGIEGEKYSF